MEFHNDVAIKMGSINHPSTKVHFQIKNIELDVLYQYMKTDIKSPGKHIDDSSTFEGRKQVDIFGEDVTCFNHYVSVNSNHVSV